MPRELRPLSELLDSAQELEKAQEQLRQLKKSTGNYLRQARESKGVTQSLFASAMGVGKSYVSQIESGDKTPSSGWLTEAYNVISSYEGGSFAYNKEKSNVKNNIKEARSKKAQPKKDSR